MLENFRANVLKLIVRNYVQLSCSQCLGFFHFLSSLINYLIPFGIIYIIVSHKINDDCLYYPISMTSVCTESSMCSYLCPPLQNTV